MKNINSIDQADRTHLHFNDLTRVNFVFLINLGFAEIESLSTIVRYQKDNVEVDIYHGRQSYEIGFGITFHGIRYSLTDFIRAANAEAIEQYHIPVMTTHQGVANGLARLSELVMRYCMQGLHGNSEFFAKLEGKRKVWMEKYWSNMEVDQIRPKANEAFQSGNYQEAVKFYKRIKSFLSPAELKKMAIAEKQIKSE